MIEKISFLPIDSENVGAVIDKLSSGSEEISLALSEISDGLLASMDEDVSFALSVACGCALIRVFDMGRYYFPFPYEISDGADIREALSLLAVYAMREEIPLVITDTPIDCLVYLSNFRHINLDKEDFDEPSYRVSVKNECELLEKIPTVEYEGLTLSALSEEDMAQYAALSRSEELLKYWGYDYKNDAPDADDSYFLECARREFESGISISMAIRVGNVFVGESVIYGFDGMGSAEFAVRILKEHQKKGYGSKSVRLTALLAKKIGLKSLRSVIMKENIASIRMVEKYMEKIWEDAGRVEFLLDIE